MPEPQTAMPRSALPLAMRLGQRKAEIGIIDRRFVMRPQVDHIVARRAQFLDQRLFQRESGMVGSEGDSGHLAALAAEHPISRGSGRFGQ